MTKSFWLSWTFFKSTCRLFSVRHPFSYFQWYGLLFSSDFHLKTLQAFNRNYFMLFLGYSSCNERFSHMISEEFLPSLPTNFLLIRAEYSHFFLSELSISQFFFSWSAAPSLLVQAMRVFWFDLASKIPITEIQPHFHLHKKNVPTGSLVLSLSLSLQPAPFHSFDLYTWYATGFLWLIKSQLAWHSTCSHEILFLW